jgi:hypothetical protein
MVRLFLFPNFFKRGPFVLFSLALVGLLIVLFRNGAVSIRFERDLLNYIFALVVLLSLAVSILWYVYLSFTGATRWISLGVISFVCAAWLFFPILFIYLDIQTILKNGYDPSFEKVEEQELNGRKYRLYRINGGATTSYGLVLRAESEPKFGMVFIRTLTWKDPAHDAKLEQLPDGRARLTIAPYYRDQAEERFEFNP